MLRLLITTLFLIALSSMVTAKNCRNSQPCGNSCISWNKTCHIGSSSSGSPATSSTYRPAPISPEAARPKPYGALDAIGQPYFVQAGEGFIRSAPSKDAPAVRREVLNERIIPYQQSGAWLRISPNGKKPEEWINRLSVSPRPITKEDLSPPAASSQPIRTPASPPKSVAIQEPAALPRPVEKATSYLYVVKAFTSSVEFPSRSAADVRAIAVGTQVPAYETLSGWVRITTGATANEWLPEDALSHSKP